MGARRSSPSDAPMEVIDETFNLAMLGDCSAVRR
jgi:hypothetical protein